MKTVAQRNTGNEADFDVVHANLLTLFPDLVRTLGGSPEDIMRRAGLEPGSASNDVPRLGYRSWVNALEHAAAELQCDDFGMRLARWQGGERILGPMGTVMKNSRTFGEALDYVANHLHAHSLAAGMRLVR